MNMLVFLQYLFSLAIVEARKDEAVKIKWPNDIYAVLCEGDCRELKKIDGVLVNTGIIHKDSQIVIGRPFVFPLLLADCYAEGCGLNFHCPRCALFSSSSYRLHPRSSDLRK